MTRAHSIASTIALIAGAAVSASQAQQFVNRDFETGDLTGWTITPTASGTTTEQTVEMTDIDGPGPLGPSLGAKFAVGQSVTGTGQQGIELTQNLNLVAGTLYEISFNWAATRDSTTANAEGGVFTLFVEGNNLVTQAAGSTSSTNPHYGFISGSYLATSTGPHRIGVRVTRPFLVPASLPPNQRLDNFNIGVSVSGACCIFTGCIIASQAACLAQGGAYQGDNTVCSAGTCPSIPPVTYSNCNLPTGTTTLSGVAAPAGGLWSECARDQADPGTANTTAGFGGTGALRLADDFVVGPGGLNLAYVKLPAYLTGATTVTATAMTIQIWNGPPNAGGTVIFGDTVTNRLAYAEFSNIYRCFPTTTGVTCGTTGTVPDATRRQQWLYGTVNQVLPAGTYWLDVNYTGCSFSPPATHPTAIGRQCNPNNSNALQFNVNWVALNDAGHGCNPTPVQQDLYFELLGTAAGSGCYPNCDGSTIVPFLNVLDFNCFLNKFAAGNTYANCDGSTIAPILNVLDFNCFLNKFAAGCSAP
jgi:hypothetical protein